jgi:hypothetical protein
MTDGVWRLLALDHRTDAVIGKNFKQQAMFDPAVDHVHRSSPRCAQRRGRRRSFGSIPPERVPSATISVDFPWGEAGEKLAGFVKHARGVGEQHQLFGLEDLGELAGHDVGVDVVAFAMPSPTPIGAITGMKSPLVEKGDQAGVDAG